MNSILYRLPEEKVVHELLCSQVEAIDNLQELGSKPGYAFVPFDVEGDDPILLFLPEEERSWITPIRFSGRHIECTSDENKRHQFYKQEFAECLRHLEAGELDKIVLSRGLRLTMDAALDDEDLRNLFIVACHHYPHSFVALINAHDFPSANLNAHTSGAWLIATPEVLLEQKEGTLRTMALAATMSIEEGVRLRPAQWSEKNRQEQRIVADYIGAQLNALGIRFSSSAVHTKIAGQLVHLCTDFSMDDTDEIGRIVSALHPTPAVCGLPTDRAATLIKAIEHHNRSYYAGFSGPIGLESGTHLFVTLRCMRIEAPAEPYVCSTARLYAGGGLLAASDCESEWIETQRKLKTMLNVLQ